MEGRLNLNNFTNEISNYINKLTKTLDSLDIYAINSALNMIYEAYSRNANIYIFGNGGSAATASHFVCDFNKGVCEKLDRKFNFICLNDNIPILMAIANDIGYESVFVKQLENRVQATDLVIAISGSGNSENVINAVKYAKSQGCAIIGLTGFDGGLLRELSDCSLHVAIDDMQITEDIHMVFDHLMMKVLSQYLNDHK